MKARRSRQKSWGSPLLVVSVLVPLFSLEGCNEILGNLHPDGAVGGMGGERNGSGGTAPDGTGGEAAYAGFGGEQSSSGGTTGSGATGATPNDGMGGTAGAGTGGSAGRCDPHAPFGAPVLIPLSDEGKMDGGMRLTPDELTAYYYSNAENPSGLNDVLRATRSTVATPFGPSTRLTALSTGYHLGAPTITDDGTQLFYATGTASGWDEIYVSERSSELVEFPLGSPVAVLNQGDGSYAITTFVIPDGSAMYFSSDRPGGDGGLDLWMAPRQGTGWGNPTPVEALNTDGDERDPVLAPSGSKIYFGRRVASGSGDYGVWTAERTGTDEPFGPAQKVVEIPSTDMYLPSWVSADDCVLYLYASISGDWDVYLAERPK